MRRVENVVRNWDATAAGGAGDWALKRRVRYVYDGWNVIAELENIALAGVFDPGTQAGGGASPGADLAGGLTEATYNGTCNLTRLYTWGVDLSGNGGTTGAGGVGGLLLAQTRVSSQVQSQPSSTTSSTVNSPQLPPITLAPAYDGNGNIVAWLDCGSGEVVQRAEYDAFGRRLGVEALLESAVGGGGSASTLGGGSAGVGAQAVALLRSVPSFGFSTKLTDAETGLSYYGYRYLRADLGRWLSKDPIEERGGINLYGFVGNDGVNRWDVLGLDGGGSFFGDFLGDLIEDAGELLEDDDGRSIDDGGPDGKSDFVHHYYHGGGATFDLLSRGYSKRLKNAVEPNAQTFLRLKLGKVAAGECGEGIKRRRITNESNEARIKQTPDLTGVIFSVGDTTLFSDVDGILEVDCDRCTWTFTGTRFHSIDDEFTDPLNVDQVTYGLWPGSGNLPFATPYDIEAHWQAPFQTGGHLHR